VAPFRATLALASTSKLPSVVSIVNPNWSPSPGKLSVADDNAMLNLAPSLPDSTHAWTENALPISPRPQPGPGVKGKELQRAGGPPSVVGAQPASAYSTTKPPSFRSTSTGISRATLDLSIADYLAD
jgi:hypothetical protein